MLHLAARIIKIDNFISGQPAILNGDAGKISAELIILVLRPLFEGMVMALVAVETRAKERLAHILGDFSRLAQDAIIVDGRIDVGATPGEQ